MVRLLSLLAAISLTWHTGALAQSSGWTRGGNGSKDRVEATPLLVDLSIPSDGRMEVLVPSFDDKLYAYNHDGTTFTQAGTWPVTLGFGDGTMASVAVGDVDPATPGAEIVVIGDDNFAKNATVKVLRRDGTTLGSRLLNTNASGKATPCLLDCMRYLNSDLHPGEEILIRDGDGQVHTLYWSQGQLQTRYSSPTFDTCTDDLQRDRFGSLPVTASVTGRFDANTSASYILAASTNNRVYRWKIISGPGTSANWQVTPMASFQSNDPTARFLSSPVLADLDQNGTDEVVAATSRREIYVWKNDTSGTLLVGWPKQTEQAIVSSPAIADLDLDGTDEIVIGCNDSKIYAFRMSGALLAGWPQVTSGDVFGSPVVAEIDGKVGLDVVATSLDGHMYAWDYTGAPLYGWPKRLNTALYSSPAVGNIHGGERMALVTAGYNGRVFVFDMAPKSLDVNLGWQQFRGGPKRQGRR